MAHNIYRKCAKCGRSAKQVPGIKLSRFPKPGPRNAIRCESWARYCFPNSPWSSLEFQGMLYSENKMLCIEHQTLALQEYQGSSSFLDLKSQPGPSLVENVTITEMQDQKDQAAAQDLECQPGLSFCNVLQNITNSCIQHHKDPKMRKKWMSAVKRVDSIGPKTKAHCCEDHFDVENDMENYVKYKLVGGKLKLKKGVVPHRFACQKQSVEKPERSVVKKLKIAKLTASRCGLRVVFKARGLMPPVFTPLNDDYTINYEVIPAYADYLTKAGIKSVLVGGTTGEHMSLNVADRKKVVDAWVKTAKTTGLHIQVQVGGAPLADVIDLASYCEKAGADSLLTLPELYFRPQNVNELVSYVELVAKAAPNLPVLYYHIPSMSKVEINMPAFVTAATARIPNFKGIKFTSNDLSEGAQVLRALKDDQEMFLGADTLLAPAALLGIKSSIGTTWNLFPRLAQDILDAVEKNDVAKARALQEKLSLAIEAHTVEGAWVPIMKAGMEIVSGIKVGPPSLPQRPIAEEARKRIKDRLRNLRIIN